MTEPPFIQQARARLDAEAEGRPDAATYREGGHAALNDIYTYYLVTPLLNPGLLADERAQGLREHYERRLQRLADLLANVRLDLERLQGEHERLLATRAHLDEQTGLPVTEALRRTRDQVIAYRHENEVLRLAIKSGSPPVGKRGVNARMENVRVENLKLHQRVRELEQQLAQAGNK